MEQEQNGTRTERNENGTMKKKRERTNLAEDPRSRTERNDLKKVGTCPALQMTRATQQTSHSIIAYPNASGCVTLTAPGSCERSGELDGMSKVSDLRKKSLNVKYYHIVAKALTYTEASLSDQVELAIGFGMREGTLRVLEDECIV